jgi:hypothetical protein
MPTEKDVLEWIGANWPSLALVLALSKAYLKIRAIPRRLKILEGRTNRLMEICSKQHADSGAFLWNDKTEGEE